jgi:hypothetical protein
VARTLVPHGETFGLGDSIKGGATTRSGFVKAGGGSIEYAGAIHFGWSGHNIEPQPFLYLAAQQAEPEVVRHFELALTTLLNRIALT